MSRRPRAVIILLSFAALMVACRPPSFRLPSGSMSTKLAALIGRDRPAPAPSAPRSSPRRAPASKPTITTQRHDLSRPPTFLLKGMTHGGKAVCEAHDNMDSCTKQCTFNLRYAGLTATPDPGMMRQCACHEMDGGC